MLELIFSVIIGLGIALFATQNTVGIPLQFGSYTYSGIPLYLVIIGALLIGLLVAWIFSLLDGISNSLRMHKTEHKVKEARSTNHNLEERIRNLEIENAKLREKANIKTTEAVRENTSPLTRLRQKLHTE